MRTGFQVTPLSHWSVAKKPRWSDNGWKNNDDKLHRVAHHANLLLRSAYRLLKFTCLSQNIVRILLETLCFLSVAIILWTEARIFDFWPMCQSLQTLERNVALATYRNLFLRVCFMETWSATTIAVMEKNTTKTNKRFCIIVCAGYSRESRDTFRRNCTWFILEISLCFVHRILKMSI